MNRLTKALVVASSLIAVTGFQAQAASAAQTDAQTHATGKMQRYTFTYNFNKPVSLVTKRTIEQQQYIQYDLVLEVQQSAHSAINTIGYDVILANRPDSLYIDNQYAK